MMRRLLGLTIPKRSGPAQVFDVPTNVLDCALAMRELGWRSTIPLEEGIVRVSAALRERLGAQPLATRK
jgi:nucleoside-diphosphate-sugar epimerase